MTKEITKVHTSRGNLQYKLDGVGKPTIVLINGGSGLIEGWMKILPDLSEMSSVFSYNRFGVTGSDKPQEPQDGLTIVETLREALKIVGIAPPFVLVGHSLGGLYANLYARRYPKVIKTMNKMFYFTRQAQLERYRLLFRKGYMFISLSSD